MQYILCLPSFNKHVELFVLVCHSVMNCRVFNIEDIHLVDIVIVKVVKWPSENTCQICPTELPLSILWSFV